MLASVVADCSVDAWHDQFCLHILIIDDPEVEVELQIQSAELPEEAPSPARKQDSRPTFFNLGKFLGFG